MPTVSIIVPNYNHAPYLEQRIDSILHQTYQDFELILLDACSADHSQRVLESYRKQHKVTHLVFNQTNSGSTFKPMAGFSTWNKNWGNILFDVNCKEIKR